MKVRFFLPGLFALCSSQNSIKIHEADVRGEVARRRKCWSFPLFLLPMAFYLSDFIAPFAGLTIFQAPVGMSRRRRARGWKLKVAK